MRILIFSILIIIPYCLQGQTEKQLQRKEKVQQRKAEKVMLSRFDSKRFRDATAAGPFPLYFTAAYVSSGGFDDFERLNQVFDESSDSFDDWKHNFRGFDVTFGGIINNRIIQNLIIEGGYTHMWRSLEDDVQKVSTRYEFGSFRVGYRVNKIGNFQIPYPLTLKIAAGPVLYSRRVFQFEALGTADPSVSKISFEGKSNIAYNGVDVHIRIDILDPVNTSGGLGLFFEYRKLFLSDSNQVNLAPVFDRLGNPAEYQSDRHSSNIAIGITIPLALRF